MKAATTNLINLIIVVPPVDGFHFLPYQHPYYIIRKKLILHLVCKKLAQKCDDTFICCAPLRFRAGCLPPARTPSRARFGKARTPTEARRAAPRLGLYIQDNDVRGGVLCVPPLCIVFLDFPSARLTAAERRQKVVRSAKRSLTSIVSLMLRFTRERGSLT